MALIKTTDELLEHVVDCQDKVEWIASEKDKIKNEQSILVIKQEHLAEQYAQAKKEKLK